MPQLTKPRTVLILNCHTRPLFTAFVFTDLVSNSVTGYSTKTASLTLEHNHPPGNTLGARVDVRLLVTTFKSNETRIGEWVTVVGYIEMNQARVHPKERTPYIGIQAIMLWSSIPFNLQSYESSLDQQHVDELDSHVGTQQR